MPASSSWSRPPCLRTAGRAGLANRRSLRTRGRLSGAFLVILFFEADGDAAVLTCVPAEAACVGFGSALGSWSSLATAALVTVRSFGTGWRSAIDFRCPYVYVLP